MMDDACLLHHVRGHREKERWDGRSGRPIRRSPSFLDGRKMKAKLVVPFPG